MEETSVVLTVGLKEKISENLNGANKKQVEILKAPRGEDALGIIQKKRCSVVIADSYLNDMSGLQLLSRSAEISPETVRIVVSDQISSDELLKAVNNVGLFRIISRPAENGNLESAVQEALSHYHNLKKARDFDRMFKGLFRTITSALEAKDPYTRGHSHRVTEYALIIGHQMNLDEEQLRILELGGSLHDIGKFGIPDAVLQKPGYLEEDEWELIKLHPRRGYMMLVGLPGLEAILPLIRNHHERLDGSGYPDGLKGDQIPLLVRIISVADAYDALTSHRPYRQAFSHQKAAEELNRCKNTQFDPDVVEALMCLRSVAEVRKVIEDTNNLPSISPIIQSVLNILEQESFEWKRVEELLSADVGITTTILRLVNSADYGLGRDVTSLQEALPFVGAVKLKDIMMTAEIVNMLRSVNQYPLWKHCLRCACFAQNLADLKQDVPESEAFTAGLLHDVGKILLNKNFVEKFQRVQELNSQGRSSVITETLIFGMTHDEIGAWLLENWKLPHSLCNAVRYHHKPEIITDSLTAYVYIANQMTHLAEEPDFSENLDEDLLERFNISFQDLSNTGAQVDKMIKGLEERFTAS